VVRANAFIRFHLRCSKYEQKCVVAHPVFVHPMMHPVSVHPLVHSVFVSAEILHNKTSILGVLSTPVAAILNEVSYRNVFCAFCHGENVSAVVEWSQVNITIPEYFGYSTL